MSTYLKFGSYTFPSGFKPISHDWSRDIAEQQRPRIAGSITQAARPQSRKLTIAGSAMGFGGGITAVQAAIDAVRTGLEANDGIQPLYFGRSDRYITAQVTSVQESYGGDVLAPSWFGAATGLSITFVAGWPYFWDAAGVQTATLSATGGMVTTGGNADQIYADYALTVSTGGTGTITLTNTTTSEAAILTGAFSSGDVIALNRGVGIYQVLKDSVATPSLMTGVIPMLAHGANNITIAATGGVVVASGGRVGFTDCWNS